MKPSSFLLDSRDKTSRQETAEKAALFRGRSREEIEAIIANTPSFSRAIKLMKKSGYTYHSTVESGEDYVIVFHKTLKEYAFYSLDTGFLSVENSFYTVEAFYWIDDEVLDHLDAETDVPMVALFSHEIPGKDGKTAYSFRLYNLSLKPGKLRIENKDVNHLIFSAKKSGKLLGSSFIGLS